MAENQLKKSNDARMDVQDLSAGTEVPAEGDFSLEEILAEYGGGRKQRILEEVDQEAAPLAAEAVDGALPTAQAEEETEQAAPSPGPRRPEADPPDPEREQALPVPPAPKPVSIEEAISFTVGSLMEEEQQEALLERKPRRGLFSRQKFEETEQLYEPPGPPPEEPEAAEEEPIGPEEPLDAAARTALKAARVCRRPLWPALLLTLLLAAPYAVEAAGYPVPLWTGDPRVQTGVAMGVLAVVCLLCRDVFLRAVQRVKKGRFSAELLTALAAAVTLADCAGRFFLEDRSPAAVYALPVCAAMTFAQWACARRWRARYDTFRAASLDDHPPYLVTELEKGACKQPGQIPGFYTDAVADTPSERWQAALLPVIFMASLIFAGLGSLGQGRNQDFLLNWSVILAAAASLILPLTDALPASSLARRLQKAGCAVAGCAGAERISRKRNLIVTDSDLFPPGTVALNGVKLFGEELTHAVSYAASLTRASGCGLSRLFGNLMVAEGGSLQPLDDFSFYEEGGFSANIRGESVILGTASFMRKMEVRLPPGINLRTGVFLAVDRQLSAVFAVKYQPSENVDWALNILRRNHIAPILASRDPNVNEQLLKRKFTAKIRVEYPDLSARLALSEQEEAAPGRPRALLLREGLLPYAETVAGSRRLCQAVKQGAAFALLGSAAGTLLAFYLTFLGSYDLMEPLRLLTFLLLWTLPVFVVDLWAGRY